MSDESKAPKEFWLGPNYADVRGCGVYYEWKPTTDGITKLGFTHVIDYQSYQSLLEAAREMKEALEFYAQIPVENDEDYFRYPIPKGITHHAAPSGNKARKALSEAEKILGEK